MAYTTIPKSSDYFNTKLYTGNGSSQALTGVGHQTDMVWIKSRTDTRKHNLYDVVRGVQKRIVPNDSVAEDTVPGVTAFGTDGFTVGSETDTNGSARNFVGWSWKANGAGSANTDGSISSTVSASATSGFSIVSYTATGSTATIGHGLGSIPKMMIIKNTTSNSTWAVYNASLGTGKFLRLQGTDAVGTEANWFDTTPTSSVFTVGSNLPSGATIAYCFADVQGFSKFGSYTGNGSGTDGTFVYTGFLPSFIMFKSTSTTGGWEIHDNKRDTFNPSSKRLFPNLSNAEATENYVDFVSNGFKFRTNDANGNTNGTSYIYMAFAEEPLVGTNPATAR